jgi:RimJ/RimL family protein N-acetyltransferase
MFGAPNNVAAKALLLEHAFEQLELSARHSQTDIRNGRSTRH